MLPPEHAGKLFVDGEGRLANDGDAILNEAAHVQAVERRPGGAWRTGPEADRDLVQKVIDRYGREGWKPEQATVGPRP